MPFKKGKKINKPIPPPMKPDNWMAGLANDLVDEIPVQPPAEEQWVQNLMNAFKAEAKQVAPENKLVWGNNFHAAIAAELPMIDEDEFNGNLHAFGVVNGEPVHEQPNIVHPDGDIEAAMQQVLNAQEFNNIAEELEEVEEINDAPQFGGNIIHDNDMPDVNFNHNVFLHNDDKIFIKKGYYKAGLIDDTSHYLAEKDCVYRIAMPKDRRHIYVIRCPKTFKGNSQELYNVWNSNTSGFAEVNHLPNSKLKVDIKVKHKVKSKKIYPRVEGTSIFNYYKETAKFYTLVSDVYEPSIVKLHGISLIETFNVKTKTCIKNATVVFRDDENILVKGFTTGKITNQNEVEIIGSRFITSGRDLEEGCFALDCKIKKYIKHYSVISTNLITYPFVRIRVKSAEGSGEMFGFKDAKSDLIGKSFAPYECRVNYKYKSLKLKRVIPIVDITVEGKDYKFLLSDIEFLYIDPEKFTNNKKTSKRVLAGSICKIIDDRRIDLVKGDIVTILEILPNKNVKKSIVVVTDKEKNLIHRVFLKQLKKIINKEEDGSKNKEQIKKPRVVAEEVNAIPVQI